MKEPRQDDGAAGTARSTRYPDYLMPLVSRVPEPDQRFAELREELLVRYGYNTARAYRGTSTTSTSGQRNETWTSCSSRTRTSGSTSHC